MVSVPQMAVIQGTRDRWLDQGRGQQSRRDLIIFVGLVALNLLGFYLVIFQGLLADVLPVPQTVSDSALGAMIGAISGAVGAVFARR